MNLGPITEAAIAGGTEEGCTKTHSCPLRLDHPGDCDQTRLNTWEVPVAWTLGNQMQFSGQLHHGKHVAQDLGSHFLITLPGIFDGLDSKFDLKPGQSEAALAAYSDWLNAIAAATNAQRIAKMHADAPHYMGRPCGATEGKVTSSAEDVKCNGCVTWAVSFGDCDETDYDERGDHDLGFARVVFKDGGETGNMCGSHAKQAAERGEVTILEILVNA